MIYPVRFLSLLAASCLVTGTAAEAAGSLFSTTDARRLLPAEQSIFGPQSSHFRYDARMLHAAQIALDRAHKHSLYQCWRYVKEALFGAGAVATYPKTEFAKEAGEELQTSYGFKKLRVADPYLAPVGSVLVYGGRGPGHVEIRVPNGFVSDFNSPKPSPRPLLGVYIKPKA